MLFSLLAFPVFAFGAAVIPRNVSICSNPATRKEWRSLSSEERTSYVGAVNCLATKPSRIGLSTTLYDDFPYIHNELNNQIHSVASFLPWHRYYIHVYEAALRDCGYGGILPYWDWTLDSSDPSHSPIWDPVTGFGGNGNSTATDGVLTRCVIDGPFKDLKPSYKGDDFRPHCLERGFNSGGSTIGDMLGQFYTPEVVTGIQALGNYNDFRIKLEGTPHGAIHSAIGGDMAPATSPNDPIFFLHHCQVDRLWWLWQQDNPSVRNAEFSGIRTQDQFDGTTPPQASVDDLLPMLGLAGDLPVEELLGTDTELLCYGY